MSIERHGADKANGYIRVSADSPEFITDQEIKCAKFDGHEWLSEHTHKLTFGPQLGSCLSVGIEVTTFELERMVKELAEALHWSVVEREKR